MKNILKIGIAFLVMVFSFGCNSNDELVIDTDNPIVGIWRLVEAYISDGGPQYWVEVDDGEEFQFLSSGTFSTDRFAECIGGNFSIDQNELSLNYACDGFATGFENSDGALTYEITFDSNYFVLIPTSVLCIEGCSYKYEKIITEE